MPTTLADDVAAAARGIRDIHVQAEARLLQAVARAVARGVDPATTWAGQELLARQALLREIDRLLADLERGVPGAVQEAHRLAYAAGTDRADQSLPGDYPRVHRAAAAPEAVLARAALDTAGMRYQIRRWAADVYDRATQEAAGLVVTGAQTRRQASAALLARLMEQGVTGFVDRSGRNWEMGAYAEMATRASSMNAALQGHSDRLLSYGIDTVYLSDHAEECERCRPWEGKVLSLTGQTKGTLEDGTRVAGTLAEAQSSGLFHPGCVVGDTRVSAPMGVRASDTRWYEGDLVVVHTASGNELAITPNHPVLTSEGWVAAGRLNVGDSLVRHLGSVEGVVPAGPDEQRIEPSIREVHHALREASAVVPVTVPPSAEQFHGDGSGSNVEVVLADGLLEDDLLPPLLHETGDGALLVGGVRLPVLLGQSALLHLVQGEHAPSGGGVGSSDLGGPLLCAHGRPLSALSLAPVGAVAPADQGIADVGLSPAYATSDFGLWHPGQVEGDGFVHPGGDGLPTTESGGLGGGPEDSGLGQPLLDRGSADPGGGRELLGRLSGQVSTDDVVQVEVRGEWSGHVFNLETGGGWYVASSIVVHNCRHTTSAYLPGVTKTPKRTADPAGDKLRQEQRARERDIRARKRRLIALGEVDGKNSTAARAERARLAERRADFARWRKEHDRKNLAYRENIKTR